MSSTELLLKMVVDKLEQIQKDNAEIKDRQSELEQSLSRMKQSQLSGTGLSVQQIIDTQKKNDQSLSKIDQDVQTTIDMLLKYSKATGFSK